MFHTDLLTSKVTGRCAYDISFSSRYVEKTKSEFETNKFRTNKKKQDPAVVTNEIQNQQLKLPQVIFTVALYREHDIVECFVVVNIGSRCEKANHFHFVIPCILKHMNFTLLKKYSRSGSYVTYFIFDHHFS